MSQPEGVVVPPASIKGPLALTLIFGALFAWAVSGLVSNWTFSPDLRNDLLVTGLGAAVAVTGLIFYMALGTLILDIGQPQLSVDDKGIKSPALPRFGWQEIEGAVLRKRGGLLRRRNCELQLQLGADATVGSRMSLWQRLTQRKALNQGVVVLSGQRWPMTEIQDAIEGHLAWYRRRSDEMERKLVRYLGERLPEERSEQQVA